MSLPAVIAIGGPTGVGKTALGIEIAQILKTEIISVDSRQIYRELNIGVGRPSDHELNTVKHHFIGSHSIFENFTAKDFQDQARQKARELIDNFGSVVLVGGTGLYFNAFFDGLDDFSETEEFRSQLNEELRLYGIQHLVHKLKGLDPIGATKIDLDNPMRVIRSLELILTHQKPLSEIKMKLGEPFEFDKSMYFLNIERENLYSQINSRVDKMMEFGFLQEAEQLFEYRNLNPLKTVGYNEIFDFIDGNITFEQSIDKMKQKTRNYAKRQITWFKNQWNTPQQNANQILNNFK